MRIFFIFLLAGLFLNPCRGQRELLLQSNISAVTVFQRGAQISRTAELALPEGSSQLILRHLSQDMDPASIFLRGQGDFSILSISHRNNFLSEENLPDDLQGLKQQIESLEVEISGSQARLEGLKSERELILANRDIGGQESGINFEQLQRIARYTSDRITEINILLGQLQRDIQKKEVEKSKLQNQLGQERSRYRNRPGEVVVEVDANKAGQARLQLGYLVRSAGWNSSYDARVDNLEGPVELTHKARIYQQTGQDWHNVELVLSTANPSAGGQVPYLSTWYVDFNHHYINGVQVSEAARLKNANMQMEQLAKDDESSGQAPQQEFKVLQNVTQQEYRVDRRQNIPSGASPTTVQLRQLDLPARYQYHLKPRLDKDAFLIAKVYDWDKYDLLSGELALFNGATYVGKSFLNVANPLDTIQLSMGRDKGIIVNRERVVDKQRTSFLGSKKIDHYAWRIEVRNNKAQEVDILLKDQVPVSRHEDIEVEFENTGTGSLDKQSGIISWKFSLGSGKGKTVEYAYKLEYPKDRPVFFQ